MRITCTRRLQFCAGHRVMGHENKCAHLHGHNYVVKLVAENVTAAGPETPGDGLDGIGRVIDFSVLKARIGSWIEERWDHGFLLHQEDRAGAAALRIFEQEERSRRGAFTQKLFLLPYNPTAENMARYLLEVVGPQCLAGTGVRLTRVEVVETENCWAEVEL